MFDPPIRRFKGFCYVEFEELSDLISALELNNGVVVEGSRIKIDVAEGKRNDRGFDRRGGRGGGRDAGYGDRNSGYSRKLISSILLKIPEYPFHQFYKLHYS